MVFSDLSSKFYGEKEMAKNEDKFFLCALITKSDVMWEFSEVIKSTIKCCDTAFPKGRSQVECYKYKGVYTDEQVNDKDVDKSHSLIFIGPFKGSFLFKYFIIMQNTLFKYFRSCIFRIFPLFHAFSSCFLVSPQPNYPHTSNHRTVGNNPTLAEDEWY